MVIIVKVAADRVEIHRIDGEVSAGGVFILFPENVVIGNDAVLVFRHTLFGKAAKGRNFNCFSTLVDMNQTEPPSDNDARLVTFLTSSGVASVATSKSFGLTPISRSRTAPPTIKALYPAS